MKKVKEESRIDEDGVKRRQYKVKREDQIMKRLKKKNRGSSEAIVHYKAHKTAAIDEEPSQDEISLTRQRTMDIKKKQEISRKLQLNRAFTDIDLIKKGAKAATVDAKKRFVRLHMTEVVEAFRACQQEDVDKTEAVSNEKGLISFAMTYEKKIQSPQLRFFDSFGVPDVEDIEMDEVPSTKLNPAGISYFFIKKRPGLDYDARKIHPSFFGADYERESSKAGMVALGAARVMLKNVNAVEKKRSRKDFGRLKKRHSNLNPDDPDYDWNCIDDEVLVFKVKFMSYVRILLVIEGEHELFVGTCFAITRRTISCLC